MSYHPFKRWVVAPWSAQSTESTGRCVSQPHTPGLRKQAPRVRADHSSHASCDSGDMRADTVHVMPASTTRIDVGYIQLRCFNELRYLELQGPDLDNPLFHFHSSPFLPLRRVRIAQQRLASPPFPRSLCSPRHSSPNRRKLRGASDERPAATPRRPLRTLAHHRRRRGSRGAATLLGGCRACGLARVPRREALREDTRGWGLARGEVRVPQRLLRRQPLCWIVLKQPASGSDCGRAHVSAAVVCKAQPASWTVHLLAGAVPCPNTHTHTHTRTAAVE